MARSPIFKAHGFPHSHAYAHTHMHALTESGKHSESREDQGPQQGHQDPQGRAPALAFTLNSTLASHCCHSAWQSVCNTHSQLSAL